MQAASGIEAGAFAHPPRRFCGIPFYAWNGGLQLERMRQEIDCFQEMGFGGFCIHVRTGLTVPYMSREFLKAVRCCEQYAEKKGMYVFLYDEDRWPSGAAGGKVTREPSLRSCHLLLTKVPYGSSTAALPPLPYSRAGNARTENGRLICCYKIELSADGCLQSARLTQPGDTSDGDLWYAYLEQQAPEAWYNGQTYIDTLNPRAAQSFLQETHIPYKKLLGNDFGGTVPAVFCDEPQTPRRLCLSFAHAQEDVTLPWTENLARRYRQAYSKDLWEDLPALLWNLPGNRSFPIRWRWNNLVTALFREAFLEPLGKWCTQNGILFTGHLMEEPTLQSQTAAVGDAMRCYAPFSLPGIDMLCRNFEYTTAKQCQSVKNQMGRAGMLSETYGATGWDFDFRSHKLHGDWQAALGVTQRVLHLAWFSMAGERKRDYPASIGCQSPWCLEYGKLEQHFARVAEVMTRGKPVVRVAVLHPIESFWLHCGPMQQTALRRDQMEQNFSELTQWLLFGGVDFDYLSEDLLPELCQTGGAPLSVGCMAYDLIFIPDCETLRQTTVSRLEAFVQQGGKLILLGSRPCFCNGEAAKTLFSQVPAVPFNRQQVLTAAEPFRAVWLYRADGRMTDNLLYQLRREKGRCWLFLAHGREPKNPDSTEAETVKVMLKGVWQLLRMDTMTGTQTEEPVQYQDGRTFFYWKTYAYDSLLLQMLPAVPESEQTCAPIVRGPQACELPIPHRVAVHLSEANSLLLDCAEASLDGEKWRKEQELLRLDTELRTELGWPLHTDSCAQPWTQPQQYAVTHHLRLRFTIHSRVQAENLHLTLEQTAGVHIVFNRQAVVVKADGSWVDASIHTVPLTPLLKGSNVLELTFPFSQETNLEWLYLLGNFGVATAGREAEIAQPVQTLCFGDIVPQGLPFYGGNVQYKIPLTTPKAGRLQVQAAHYRGALMTVALDGSAPEQVFLPPYCWKSELLAAGAHIVTITLFGNRFNQFGPLHLFDRTWKYMGPASWRTTGAQWSDTWQFRRTGILSKPVVLFREETERQTKDAAVQRNVHT